MPVIDQNTSELLKAGYHRLRHPEDSENASSLKAYEARLQAIRERKNAPLPTWREIWNSFKEAWIEAGKVWEKERAIRLASKSKSDTAETLQL